MAEDLTTATMDTPASEEESTVPVPLQPPEPTIGQPVTTHHQPTPPLASTSGSLGAPPRPPTPKPTPAPTPAPTPSPTPAPNPDPCETVREPVKINLTNAIVLRPDGRNYLQNRSVLPTYLQSLPFAFEVVNKTLRPGGTADNQRKYNIGNRSARLLFCSTVDSGLYTSEFYLDAAIVTADELWSRLQKRFQKTTGLFQEQAINAWLAYTFDTSLSIEQNIELYNRLVFTLNESRANIPSTAISSRLLNSLPPDYGPFKQAWSTRQEDDKELATLMELIRAGAARRAIEDGVTDVTTLVSRFRRMNMRGRRVSGRRPRPPPRRYYHATRQQTTTRRTVVTCWNCGRVGHKSTACRSPRRTKQQSPQQQQTQEPTQQSPQRRNRRGRPTPRANFAEVFMCEASVEPPRAGSARLVVDSGSTHNCLSDPALFDEIKTLSASREVRLAGSSSPTAEGCGPATLIVRQGDKLVEMKLKNALFVPGMNVNLLSVGQLSTEGYRIGFTPDGISISTGRVKIIAKKSNGLYVLNIKAPARVNNAEASEEDAVSLRLAHETLSHISIDKVKKTLELQGIPYQDDFTECDACLKGKLHKQPSRPKPTFAKADRPGRLFADTCDTTETSLSGNRHFLCIVDDHTRFRAVYFLKHKGEAAQHI